MALPTIRESASKMNYHLCPVCGYNKMSRPPAAGYICPCCGIEFELDDDEKNHEQLRAEWIANGCRWWSHAVTPQAGWDAIEQLKQAGHGHDLFAFTGGMSSIEIRKVPYGVPNYSLSFGS